ncbi:MAG TPA: Crp/Fnr family transcriptional regulator [Candidatus Pristimantibacillus sp.]|jgi:CRP/FNR family transcriptional regulator|nr:Crp/Fnr family transcriptional regulator [Candidatus Pristimantibacillus sp.]
MDTLPLSFQRVLRTSRVKHFPKDQIIQYIGDTVNEVFFIKTGAVKIYDIDEQGNEKILHIVKTPAIVPFAFFSGEGARARWFYSALTDCDVYVMDREQLRRTMLASGKAALGLVENFSTDVHELLVRLSSLGKTNTHDKLIAALKFLQARHAEQRPSGWWRVSFPVNHQLLADMVGVTRESVSVVMKELQDKKIIRNPRLTILEIRKERLHGEGA